MATKEVSGRNAKNIFSKKCAQSQLRKRVGASLNIRTKMEMSQVS